MKLRHKESFTVSSVSNFKGLKITSHQITLKIIKYILMYNESSIWVKFFMQIFVLSLHQMFQITRMKTSISSEALSQSGAEKITFSPKPDRQTYEQTDISIYRVDQIRFLMLILGQGKDRDRACPPPPAGGLEVLYIGLGNFQISEKIKSTKNTIDYIYHFFLCSYAM